jgi:hypothetical protein
MVVFYRQLTGGRSGKLVSVRFFLGRARCRCATARGMEAHEDQGLRYTRGHVGDVIDGAAVTHAGLALDRGEVEHAAAP